MRRFSRQDIGVVQGSRVLFSDFIDDGPMWTGSGPRRQNFPIRFDEAYASPPMVHVAMSMWDSDSQMNQRMDIAAENITADGFDLVFRTWGDSRVARVRADWLVIGAVPNEDDWDLD